MPKKEAIKTFEDLLKPTKHSKQAEKIINKLGGVPKVVALLAEVGVRRSRFSVYKWMYPKKLAGHGGTGGVFPQDMREAIRLIAQLEGITLTKKDWE